MYTCIQGHGQNTNECKVAATTKKTQKKKNRELMTTKGKKKEKIYFQNCQERRGILLVKATGELYNQRFKHRPQRLVGGKAQPFKGPWLRLQMPRAFPFLCSFSHTFKAMMTAGEEGAVKEVKKAPPYNLIGKGLPNTSLFRVVLEERALDIGVFLALPGTLEPPPAVTRARSSAFSCRNQHKTYMERVTKHGGRAKKTQRSMRRSQFKARPSIHTTSSS